VRARRDGDSTGAYGWFNRATKSIVVLTDALPHQQFATLVHELAYAILPRWRAPADADSIEERLHQGHTAFSAVALSSKLHTEPIELRPLRVDDALDFTF
jgi:hypothetical protein